MTDIKADNLIRLKQDFPELGLRRGDLGIVCSTWFDPNTAFEVEFESDASGFPVHALLMPNQIEKNATGS